ncbi:MAG: SCO family protein [Deltaproteobacteria bacterium]|nr:SCO family protein [Deltaproteobacteria bacterium]
MPEQPASTSVSKARRSPAPWVWLLLGLFLVMSAGSVLLLSRQLGGISSSSLPDYGAVPDFQLTERNGATLSRAELIGGVWVADFIFTRCQGSCPLLATRMAAIQQQLPTGSKQPIRLVSFSVDPDWDTPERLREYAARYRADPKRWLFLTGSYQTMTDLIRNGFHLGIVKAGDAPNAAPSEPIIHSDRLVLVDSTGRIRGYYQATNQEGFGHLLQDLEVLRRE